MQTLAVRAYVTTWYGRVQKYYVLVGANFQLSLPAASPMPPLKLQTYNTCASCIVQGQLFGIEISWEFSFQNKLS